MQLLKHEMEEALRESEEKFRNIFESANDAMIYLDRSGRILDVNRKAVEVFGGSKRELLGKHFTRVGIFSFREIPTLLRNFANIHAGKKVTLNISIKNKKGKEIPLECSASLMKTDDKIAGIMVIARDVTERKRAEDRIRASEERFRNLHESVPDALAVYVGKEGHLIEYNKAFKKAYEYTDEELKDKTFLDFVHPDDHALVLERYRTKYPEEELPLVYEITAVNKKGETIPIEISVNTYKKKGRVIGIEVIHRDITERKKAEEELIRLSSAVKMSTDSIVISDLNGKIIDVNEATLKMYGTNDKGDLIGKNSFDLIVPEEREKAFAAMEDVLEKGYIKGREYHIVTKDGGRVPVEMSVAIMKDVDGKPIGFTGISRDITERKKMEEALKLQRDVVVTLSGAGNFIETLNRLFDNLLEIEEFDCAGFYLVDKDTGELDMIVHRGLPDGFVEKVGHLDADSPYAKVVMDGKPIYQKTSDFPPAIREDLQSDGILTVAVIPIQYEGEVIGDLNMASHTHNEISASTRHVLESVGAQIGEAIVRVRMEKTLRESEEKLEEQSQAEKMTQEKMTEWIKTRVRKIEHDT